MNWAALRRTAAILAVAGVVSLPAAAAEESAASVAGLRAAALAPQAAPQQGPSTSPRDLFVRVGKSLVVDSPVTIERVSVASAIAEAVAVSPREILVNGLTPGQTSMIMWQQGGRRLLFDLNVLPDNTRLDSVRNTIQEEFATQEIDVTLEHGTVFLRGRVSDVNTSDRVTALASILGERIINLLHVDIPDVETQILLHVKFASLDRSATENLGASYVLPGAFNQQTSISTGTFAPPTGSAPGSVSLNQALNIFIFRPDIDFGATIAALSAKNLLQLLAEPNLLAINNKPASFLAGGEFPYPTVQGGGFGGSVTIAFREFGVRLNFTPSVTPRGTIRLQVEPEVSSLDFANGLVFQGFTIPALSTRRVQTEIELENGQSFAIGGLLDNRMQETFTKVPGIGDIPIIGKLFRTRQEQKNNGELLVTVTPEIVRPMPAGMPRPAIEMPRTFLEGTRSDAPRTAGIDQTGPVPVTPPKETMPVEELRQLQQQQSGAQAPQQPVVIMQRPWTMPAGPQGEAPQAAPAPAAPAPATPQGN